MIELIAQKYGALQSALFNPRPWRWERFEDIAQARRGLRSVSSSEYEVPGTGYEDECVSMSTEHRAQARAHARPEGKSPERGLPHGE